LGRLLFRLGEAHMTGVIRVLAPIEDCGEEKHELYLRRGRVVHVRPPSLDEPLGHVLCELGVLDHETYARSLLRMAEERARHGSVLKGMGLIDDRQLAGALAVQILRRSARMFALRDGHYNIDLYDHEHGRPEDGEIAARGVGVRRVIYSGVQAGYREADLVWELNLLAGRRVRLRRAEARRLGRYGFGSEARGVLELLAGGFCEVAHLLAQAEGAPSSDSTAPLKVLYTLLITEMLELEQPTLVESRDPTLRFVRPPPPEPVTPLLGSSDGAATPDPQKLEGKARFLRGEAYLRRGDLKMALANLIAAEALLPIDPDVKAMLALAVWRSPSLDAKTRADRAHKLLADALARAPACVRAYRASGEIYAAQKQLEQAVRCYAKVLELVPGDREALRALTRLQGRSGGSILPDQLRRK